MRAGEQYVGQGASVGLRITLRMLRADIHFRNRSGAMVKSGVTNTVQT